jgi:hypothetical protein
VDTLAVKVGVDGFEDAENLGGKPTFEPQRRQRRQQQPQQQRVVDGVLRVVDEVAGGMEGEIRWVRGNGEEDREKKSRVGL